MTKENYKGSKDKVDAFVKKLIKDNMYEPNEEEQWLIDEYDKFNHHAKKCLQVFEKYYVAVWDDLKKRRRMDIEIFEEHLEHPNYYLLDLLVYDFIKKTVKKELRNGKNNNMLWGVISNVIDWNRVFI